MISHLSETKRLIFSSVVLALFVARAHGGAEAEAVGHFQKDIQPLLVTYCYDCHGDGEKKGNVAFDQLKTDQTLLDHDLWFKALKNVRAGIMPAGDGPKPKTEEVRQLENWIKRDVFGLDPANPDPGRVTLRRLNRTEYHNTIKDLMGTDFKVEEEFPPDDTGYGFDNIGDVLTVSPMLLEKYMQAAETVVTQAVPTVAKVVREKTIAGADFVHGGRPNPDRSSFGKEAKFSQKVNIEQAGEYRVTVQLSVHGSFDFDPTRAKVSFGVDGEQLFQEEYGWQDGKKYTYEYVKKWEPGEREMNFEVHPIVAEKPQTEQAQEEAAADQQQQQALQQLGVPPRKVNIDLRIINVRVQGPLDQERWIAPENYTRFFDRSEAPATEPQRRDYAREVLSRFATKAFRRPVDQRTLDRLVAIAEGFYNQPGKGFEHGIQQAMIAVLASPRFIFRVEDAAASEPKDKAFALVDEYALASRMSYLLWSTMPDDELFALAQRGELRKNLDAQLKRMLADPRSESLIQNFTGQWLEARDVDSININARVVLARDAGTEKQMAEEDEAIRAARRGGRGRQNAPANGAAQQNQQAPPAAQADAQQQQQADVQAAVQAAVPAPAQAQIQAQVQDNQQPQAQANQPTGAPAAGARGNRGNRGRGAFGGRRGGAGGAPPIDLDRELRTAMRRETEMYFGYIVREDRSILELIDSNYTFLNERLARHYGIPDVTGIEMRKVELPPGNPRGGVLTQGSFLVVTSNPTRTSPVKRGLFILDNILGTPAPAPPNDIPPLEQAEKAIEGHEPTVRESMALHREKALCASCHVRMDALGLALENFNALGMWRTKERGQDIDASGQLITGEQLKNVADLKKVLQNERRMDFYRCLTEKFLTYALGRGLDYYDTETVDQIVDRLQKNDGKFSALLTGVIESAPFQKRRSIAAPVAVNEQPQGQQTASIEVKQ